MEVIVDGIIYQYQSYGGISRLYSEILPRMCTMDDSIHISLLTSVGLNTPLPVHSHIHQCYLPPVERFLRPTQLWWPFITHIRVSIARLKMKIAKGSIWHSTYYTMLPKWDGPVVVTVVDMIYERFGHLFNGLMNDLFRTQKRRCVVTADIVVCISETTKRDVQEFYSIDADKIEVVPLAFSKSFRLLNKIERSFFQAIKRPFFLYVGDRPHYKNFQGLLHAYSAWMGEKEVDLIVVGKPWSREEKRSLSDLHITDRVHLWKHVDDQTLCFLYNQALAFIYPSFYEGFGIPLLEAMACGCPVVASRIPSTIEIAGECPIYFEPKDTGDFLTALDTAFSEGRSSERVRLGLNLVNRYSWDNTARQTLEIYRGLGV